MIQVIHIGSDDIPSIIGTELAHPEYPELYILFTILE